MANILKNVDKIITSAPASKEIDLNNLSSGPSFSATGGTESTFTDTSGQLWKVHTFLSTSTFITTAAGDIEYFIVAGGGGSGKNLSGGGGGGGVIKASASIAAGTYTITVGGAGAAGTAEAQAGGNGGDSSIVGGSFSEIAIGGGGGSAGNHTSDAYSRAKNGGSGGGASANNGNHAAIGYGTAGQGMDGGSTAAGSNNNYASAGGGGYSQKGQSLFSNTATKAGKGGDGYELVDFDGYDFWYAGGGGGGIYIISGATGGNGGRGGGGGGMPSIANNMGLMGADCRNHQTTYPAAFKGAENSGGGGGGSGNYNTTLTGHNAHNRTGHIGGSGIVIIRYRG